jgi:hypothetical protein
MRQISKLLASESISISIQLVYIDTRNLDRTCVARPVTLSAFAFIVTHWWQARGVSRSAVLSWRSGNHVRIRFNRFATATQRKQHCRAKQCQSRDFTNSQTVHGLSVLNDADIALTSTCPLLSIVGPLRYIKVLHIYTRSPPRCHDPRRKLVLSH